MRIKVLIKTVTILYLLGGCFSCATDESPYDIPEDPFKDGSIPLEVPLTKSVNGTDPELRVKSVRLIILKNNKVTNNEFLDNIPNASTNVILSAKKVPIGKVDYFLIANELSSWGFSTSAFDVGNIVFPKTIKEKIISYTAYPKVDLNTNLIPMFNHYDGLNVVSGTETNYQGANIYNNLGILERLYAKVSLKLICNFKDLQNGGEAVELESISIKHMPKEAYLYPYYYDKSNSTDFFDGDITGVIANSNYVLTGTGINDGFSGDFSFYIPEHLVQTTSNKTYISAVLRLIEDVNIKKEFKIVLGDSITRTDHGMSNILEYMSNHAGVRALRISRNTHFNVKATIIGFDETSSSNMDIVAKIIDWNDGGMIGPDPSSYFLNLSQSEFKIGTSSGTTAVPYEGVVNVTTDNTDGWKVTAQSAGVTIVSTSNDKLQFRIASSLSVTSWTIDITTGKVTKQIKITR